MLCFYAFLLTDIQGPSDSWTIHGLWPDNCDGTYKANCDDSRAYTNISAILKSYGQTDLLDCSSPPTPQEVLPLTLLSRHVHLLDLQHRHLRNLLGTRMVQTRNLHFHPRPRLLHLLPTNRRSPRFLQPRSLSIQNSPFLHLALRCRNRAFNHSNLHSLPNPNRLIKAIRLHPLRRLRFGNAG